MQKSGKFPEIPGGHDKIDWGVQFFLEKAQ